MSLMKEIHDDDSRWSEVMDWPLMVAAAAFLVAYAVPILNPGISPTLRIWCEVVQWVTWAMFALDYFARLRASEDRGRWFVRHLHELAIIVLPMFRQLRILRVVTVLSVVNRHATVGFRGRVTSYLIGGAILLSFVAALSVLDAERKSPEANITDFDDAWWWALTTMTTVGYGDRFPVTGMGRLIAGVLMICGIGLLGTVTAMLASWFSERVANQDAAANKAIIDELRALREEVSALRAPAAPTTPAADSAAPDHDQPPRPAADAGA